MKGIEMRKIREQMGMEQPELAEALGKAKRAETVSRWENGKLPISGGVEKLLRRIFKTWKEGKR